MELGTLSSGIFIGIISSLAATYIYCVAKKRRAKYIKDKINDLQEEEEFLERISKGSIQLLRSCFNMLFLTVGILACSIGLMLFVRLIGFPEYVAKVVQTICASMIIGSGLGALEFSIHLRKLKNLAKAKGDIHNKRRVLEKKIKSA